MSSGFSVSYHRSFLQENTPDPPPPHQHCKSSTVQPDRFTTCGHNDTDAFTAGVFKLWLIAVAPFQSIIPAVKYNLHFFFLTITTMSLSNINLTIIQYMFMLVQTHCGWLLQRAVNQALLLTKEKDCFHCDLWACLWWIKYRIWYFYSRCEIWVNWTTEVTVISFYSHS